MDRRIPWELFRRPTTLLSGRRFERLLLAATAGALTAGGIAWLAGAPDIADLCWGLGTVIAVVPAVVWVLAALQQGHAGVDLIAVLALGGTLAVREYLAGALIALMPAPGRTLDAPAQRRASHDLRALLEHAPIGWTASPTPSPSPYGPGASRSRARSAAC
ncbi:hypothetical protein [Streptomyces mirabilis]|uniref:hypothetical protein n=1 Tax=Streptomyces mirabilis TaxID=68239 RepID=UPI003330EB29